MQPIKVANEVWLAAALLTRENPGRPDFSVSEIVQRVIRENLAGEYRPGIQVHASTHCVAGKLPNPARFRMLTETTRSRRRLYRPGDPVHLARVKGKIRPDREELPPDYSDLVDWYDRFYAPGLTATMKRPPGTSPAEILRLAGNISKENARELKHAIASCEKVDLDAW